VRGSRGKCQPLLDVAEKGFLWYSQNPDLFLPSVEWFMEQALRLIAEYQWWIYAVFGLILLFYLRSAFVARRDSVRSIFRLEQEQSRARYGRSVGVAVLILVLMGAIFGVVNFLLPELQRPAMEPTPTATTGPLVAPTLTATAAPPTITTTATATLVRPTRPQLPTDTPEVEATQAPVVAPAACPNPNVRIVSPGMNQMVSGNFPVRGTASIDGFQYYKIEIGPGTGPKDNEWTVVGQLHNNAIAGGVLGTLNSTAYPAGTYTLRLVVVDQTGNYPEPCRVTINIQN
jgi:hypothetical protein